MGKKVKKTLKKVVKVVAYSVAGFMVGGPIGAAAGFGASMASQFGKEVGKILGKDVVDDVLGLESFGSEVQRWGADLQQVGKVLTGEYHKDLQEIQEAQARFEEAKDDYDDDYRDAANSYNSGIKQLTDRLDQLSMFGEIYVMAQSNKIDEYGNFVGPSDVEMLKLYKEYKDLVDTLKREYDFIVSLQNGGIVEKIVYSYIAIIGGLTHDMTSILDGSASSDQFKNILKVVIAVVLIVISILLSPFTGGASLVWTVQTVLWLIAIIGAMISLVLTLDGMYAQGAALGSVFDTLDFLFNDIMNLDDLVGSDFDKFDADNEDYAEMQQYFKTAIVIVSIIAALGASYGSSMSSSSTTTQAVSPTTNTTAQTGTTVASTTEPGSMIGSIVDFSQNGSILGVHVSNYKALYEVYTTAMSVKDLVASHKAYSDLKDKLESDLSKVNTVIMKQTNKNFIKHYKDTEYMLNDQQESIDRYLASMTAENMYVDPYAVTPVANMRFTPDKNERKMTFGFEELFSYENQAGGSNYFKSMLYMT